MINVEFRYNEDDVLSGFTVSGHAGFDEYGSDIVCAAVSVLTINTVNSLESLTDCDMSYEASEDGMVKLDITTVNDSSKLLMDSFYLGIDTIINTYGNEYVRIV